MFERAPILQENRGVSEPRFSLKERGAAPLVIKADIGKVADIQRMFETMQHMLQRLQIQGVVEQQQCQNLMQQVDVPQPSPPAQ
jgi:hypothetical protein